MNVLDVIDSWTLLGDAYRIISSLSPRLMSANLQWCQLYSLATPDMFCIDVT